MDTGSLSRCLLTQALGITKAEQVTAKPPLLADECLLCGWPGPGLRPTMLLPSLLLFTAITSPAVSERTLEERVVVRPVDVAGAAILKVSISAVSIDVLLVQERICREQQMRVRRIGSFLPRPWAMPTGLGLSAVGGGLLLTAGALAAMAPSQPSINDQFSRDELSQEGATTLAVASGVVGFASAAAGALIALFVGDELASDRVQEDVIDTTTRPCDPTALPDRSVRLRPQEGMTLEGTTDADGHVRFALPSLRTVPDTKVWAHVESINPNLILPVELPASAYFSALETSDLAAFERFARVFGAALPAGLGTRHAQLLSAKKEAEVLASLALAQERQRIATQVAADRIRQHDAAEAAFHEHLAAGIDSLGRCVTCADGADVAALLMADAEAGDGEHAAEIEVILARLRSLSERPRVSNSDELQGAIDDLCLQHLHPNRLVFHPSAGFMVRVADLTTVDLDAALAKKPAVFGIPLAATLPALACRSEPLVSDCRSGDDLWSSFPPFMADSARVRSVQCQGPKGVVYFESAVGRMVAATLDPTTLGVGGEALLTEVRRSYGKAQRRLGLVLFFIVRVAVWEIGLSRGGIFFEAAEGKATELVGNIEYRDTAAITHMAKAERAAARADQTRRAREVDP